MYIYLLYLGSVIREDEVYKHVKARVENTIRFGPQLETPFKSAERFLRRHVNEKLKMAVLIADIAGSTKLSLELPSRVLASIIQVFSQEMTMLVTAHSGYVLKYIGDAILSFFPAEYNPTIACNTAVRCAASMINIINNAINPVIIDAGYPRIHAKVGIDFGQNLVVMYGKGIDSYVDIIGSAVSMASKISSIAGADQLIIGQDAYLMLDKDLQSMFIEFNVSAYRWNFIDPVTRDTYKLYMYNG